MTKAMQHGLRFGASCLLCAMLGGCVTAEQASFAAFVALGAEPALRVTPSEAFQRFSGNERVLVVSLVPGRAAVERPLFKQSVIQEVRGAFDSPVFSIDADDDMSEYVTPANLIAYGDALNVDEVSRLGRLFGASHVLCVLVRSSQVYHPQLLSTSWVLIESKTSRQTLQMDALLDAADQDTFREMGRYLTVRRARKDDMQSLELMLRSPREYGRFVASLCSHALAESLYGDVRLKTRRFRPIEKGSEYAN
jgi:hypothetical protein